MSHSKNLAKLLGNQEIFCQWIWALPVILVVFALSISQIDLYSPSRDEFNSLVHASRMGKEPRSPSQIIKSIRSYSPDHAPGYYMILSLWGNLVNYDVAMARTLSIFAGVLALCFVYRLARDVLDPIAGLSAVVIVASNAFYNFYYVHIRMYPMIMLAACITLWLYWRIMYGRRQVNQLNYLALFAAVFSLCSLHFLNGVFLAVIGIYHLLCASKNKRWMLVSITVILAVMLFLPYFLTSLESMEQVIDRKRGASEDARFILHTWLAITTNNAPLLMVLSIAGLALGYRKQIYKVLPWLKMTGFFLVFLTVLAQFTSFLSEFTMRYHLANWLPMILVLSAGVAGLYKFRNWTLPILLLWIGAGYHFNASAYWWTYLNMRYLSFFQPPTHVISRLALAADLQPTVLFATNDSFYRFFLTSPGYNALWAKSGITPADFFFKEYGIKFADIDDPGMAVRRFAIDSPTIWVYYNDKDILEEKQATIDAHLRELNYELCQSQRIEEDTVIVKYFWQTLYCQPPGAHRSYSTENIQYSFYEATLNEAGSALIFNDRWTSRGDGLHTDYNLSYQLISADWDNVAQVDIPLDDENHIRQFAIDVAGVAAGSYKLMVILYHKDTGARVSWNNIDGWRPHMLPVAEISLPATNSP